MINILFTRHTEFNTLDLLCYGESGNRYEVVCRHLYVRL